MGVDDAERFEEVFDDHSAAVLAYLLRRTDRAAAEDALSETFLVAWRRREELPAEPLPWLYGVARHVLLNQRKSDRRRAALVQRLGRTRAGAATADPADAVRSVGSSGDGPAMRALRTLAAPDREVLLLDAWEQLSSTDGGAVLGISAEAYRARLSRAKRRLRRAVENAGEAAAPAGDPSAVPTPSSEVTR